MVLVPDQCRKIALGPGIIEFFQIAGFSSVKAQDQCCLLGIIGLQTPAGLKLRGRHICRHPTLTSPSILNATMLFALATTATWVFRCQICSLNRSCVLYITKREKELNGREDSREGRMNEKKKTEWKKGKRGNRGEEASG